MYNVDKIDAWRIETQAKLDKIMEKESKKLNKIIKREIKRSDILRMGMGTSVLCNKNDECYENDLNWTEEVAKARLFKQKLTLLQYFDVFELSPTIENINDPSVVKPIPPNAEDLGVGSDSKVDLTPLADESTLVTLSELSTF